MERKRRAVDLVTVEQEEEEEEEEGCVVRTASQHGASMGTSSRTATWISNSQM